MKILLINPEHLDRIKNDDHLFLPLGLLAIASYLAQNLNNVSLDIVDMELEGRNGRKSTEVLKTLKADFDIVGITDHYTNFYNALNIAEKVKKFSTKSLIVFGGVHATACHKEIIDNFPFVDAVVRGEGEIPFLQLAKNVISRAAFYKNVHSITYRVGGVSVSSTEGNLLDLKTIPPINYSFIDIAKYLRNKSFSKRQWVESGRGCLNRCKFCSSSLRWRNSIRYCSLEKIHADIKNLKTVGINNIMFTHDNILFDKKYAKRLCEDIVNNGVKIDWSCYARVKDLTKGIIRTISSAGCKSVFVGFETSSKKIQKYINKEYDCKKAVKIVSNCVKHGIDVNGNFIFDLPGSNATTIEKDLKFALKLRFAGACNIQFSCLKLMPGSAVYERISIGKIKLMDYFRRNIACSRHVRNKLFSFFIMNGRAKIQKIPAWAIGEIGSFLLEYFPFTMFYVSDSMRHKILPIINSVYAANKRMLNHGYSDYDLYKVVEQFIKGLHENDSFLDDIKNYEISMNRLSFNKKCGSKVKIEYDIMKYINNRKVYKLANPEFLWLESTNDGIATKKGG